MSETMRVHTITKATGPDGARYDCIVETPGETRHLYFEVVSSAGPHTLAKNDDWIVLSLLMLAMKAGQTLEIESRVSPLLLHAARGDIQHLLRRLDPGLSLVEVKADVSHERLARQGNLRVGTGFSAGIDSFAALGSFAETGLSSDLEITDVFTFNVGALGGGLGANVRNAFRLIFDRALEFAALTGSTAHGVNSNLHLFYTGVPGMDFQRTHTMRNMAAASIFQSEIDCYLYASTFGYGDLDLTATYDLAHFDPLLLPLLAPEGMRFLSANAGIDRVEKTRLTAGNPIAKQLLDVCVAPTAARAEAIRNRRNCSRCWKCARTMITLDGLGHLDEFARVFDLDHYRAHTESIVELVRRKGRKGSSLDQAAYDCYIAAWPGQH